ncbi:bifunctional glutamine amidotransferase/anthranilate phosphoribosyltransferase [Calderihabitans maritimus]|uniref:Anthranilate phosphoribosyltransferase n=2 Tax=Calderihabitans maritimus TaxID=1246530 RepID=A0A1Z5HN88_9FIRM|nr:anthranilate phosphoribosyltransferase [Calderihabitans maritimus]GAW90992.1 bifunctional glutamine amidotransferase/anthranilate phosphoribosyltransferase [Calderihabitans maritimus]
MRDILEKLVNGIDLSEEEAQETMERIMEGKATPSQIASFLTALRIKGETVEEITGFARTMRAKAERVEVDISGLVDTCGTGGDGRNTFNISTTAAFVVAGAGLPVAKHGNRSVSSRCGSADVLESLGVNIDMAPSQVARCLKEVGVGFLFAPRFHGAMKYAVQPRREIGIRTVFNILGPLTNPAGAQAQVVGVFHPDLTEVMAQVLQRLGCRRAFVVHGTDGLDEVTLTGPSKITRLEGDEISTFFLEPEEVGLERGRLEDIQGGSAEINAAIARQVLEGRPGPCRDVVLLNAAFGLMAGGLVDTVREGIALAAESIDSGAARQKLLDLIEFSRSSAA